jgi:hypothetical protein
LATEEEVMSDTSGEDQATLAIVFEDNVRELVRKHLKEALEDHSFMGSISTNALAANVFRGVSPHNIDFNRAVKDVISTQMSKY